MNKPSGWDDVAPKTGGFEKPAPGPVVMRIIKAVDTKSRNNDNMLVIGCDIAEGSLAGYYTALGDRFGADKLLVVQNTDTEKSLPYLKGTIESVEKSNPGFVYDWNAASLVGKLIGANLREEEYIDKVSGEVKSSIKIGHVCPVDDVRSGKVKVMKPKLVDESKRPVAEPAHDDSDMPF